MQSQKAPSISTKNRNDLTTEIASLISEGFLAFHPTSPMHLKIQVALQAYGREPESRLIDQVLKYCEPEIKALANSVL